jgi:hypothetical protein
LTTLIDVVATPFLLQIGVKLGQVVQGMVSSIECTEAADIRPGDVEIRKLNVHRSPSGDDQRIEGGSLFDVPNSQ